jgi:hypothetical protein
MVHLHHGINRASVWNKPEFIARDRVDDAFQKFDNPMQTGGAMEGRKASRK